MSRDSQIEATSPCILVCHCLQACQLSLLQIRRCVHQASHESHLNEAYCALRASSSVVCTGGSIIISWLPEAAVLSSCSSPTTYQILWGDYSGQKLRHAEYVGESRNRSSSCSWLPGMARPAHRLAVREWPDYVCARHVVQMHRALRSPLSGTGSHSCAVDSGSLTSFRVHKSSARLGTALLGWWEQAHVGGHVRVERGCIQEGQLLLQL